MVVQAKMHLLPELLCSLEGSARHALVDRDQQLVLERSR